MGKTTARMEEQYENAEGGKMRGAMRLILSSFFFSIKGILRVRISLGGRRRSTTDCYFILTFMQMHFSPHLHPLCANETSANLPALPPPPVTVVAMYPKSMRNTSQPGSALSSPPSFGLEDGLDAYSSSDGAALAPIRRLGELWEKKKRSKYKFLAVIKMARLPDSVKALSFQALLSYIKCLWH